MMIILAALLGGLAVSYCLTMIVRAYAVRRAILDYPNDRSMHARPVARGGGLAIALTFCCGLGLLAWANLVERNLLFALIGGAILITLIGWIDDVRQGIPARVRVAVQFTAAVWALAWLGGLPAITIGATTISTS